MGSEMCIRDRMLVDSSQDTNMKLVEVARWLTREAAGRGTRSGPRKPSQGPDAMAR